jgi:hypothetical protein
MGQVGSIDPGGFGWLLWPPGATWIYMPKTIIQKRPDTFNQTYVPIRIQAWPRRHLLPGGRSGLAHRYVHNTFLIVLLRR